MENTGDIRKELKELNSIIDAIEITLDYGEKVSKEDYENYERAIKRRTEITSILEQEQPVSEMLFIWKGVDDKYDSLITY